MGITTRLACIRLLRCTRWGGLWFQEMTARTWFWNLFAGQNSGQQVTTVAHNRCVLRVSWYDYRSSEGVSWRTVEGVGWRRLFSELKFRYLQNACVSQRKRHAPDWGRGKAGALAQCHCHRQLFQLRWIISLEHDRAELCRYAYYAYSICILLLLVNILFSNIQYLEYVPVPVPGTTSRGHHHQKCVY